MPFKCECQIMKCCKSKPPPFIIFFHTFFNQKIIMQNQKYYNTIYNFFLTISVKILQLIINICRLIGSNNRSINLSQFLSSKKASSFLYQNLSLLNQRIVKNTYQKQHRNQIDIFSKKRFTNKILLRNSRTIKFFSKESEIYVRSLISEVNKHFLTKKRSLIELIFFSQITGTLQQQNCQQRRVKFKYQIYYRSQNRHFLKKVCKKQYHAISFLNKLFHTIHFFLVYVHLSKPKFFVF
eukprot:TRINITY_DN29482_c0_g1_i1.p2 TRINITY_DN29482_c0_g1~~TRINITY_DN29482_c0_g1_i1.p2  ORF type:complete len:238 (+),score=-4.75 TRINITY_DN29482_c0_g1_i1:914-1627(+)